jgi:hypothetical protein
MSRHVLAVDVADAEKALVTLAKIRERHPKDYKSLEFDLISQAIVKLAMWISDFGRNGA